MTMWPFNRCKRDYISRWGAIRRLARAQGVYRGCWVYKRTIGDWLEFFDMGSMHGTAFVHLVTGEVKFRSAER